MTDRRSDVVKHDPAAGAAKTGVPTQEALEAHLAPYAAHSAQSRGRRFPEAAPSARTEFQRDRDRIVHSTAFRRLEY